MEVMEFTKKNEISKKIRSKSKISEKYYELKFCRSQIITYR